MTATEPDPIPAPGPAPHPRRSRIRWRRWLPRAIFETVLIVFSVMLALAVTGWADDMRTAHRVQEMRTFLIQEMRSNRAKLAAPDIIPRHEALKKAFASAGGVPGGKPTRETVEPALTMLFSTGINQVSVRNAVWISASNGDLFEHMALEDLFLFAEVYRTQETLERVNSAGYENAIGLVDILSEDGGNIHRQTLRMTLFLEDLAQAERDLLAAYDAALAKLDPSGASKAPAA